MFTFEELEERYGKQPRKMDTYLRPLSMTDTGMEFSWPWLKLILLTLISGGLSYYGIAALEMKFGLVSFIVMPLYLGVGLYFIRGATSTEHNVRLLRSSPMVSGRVVRGHNKLYAPGVERAKASVVFSRQEDHRHDMLYLKDVAKRVRSAVESGQAPDDLTEAVAMVNESQGRALQLPKRIAADGDTWLAVVDVNPERLPENKLVDQKLLLISAPEDNLVVQI